MITLKSYAKINLTLDLVGKREDGYHLLRSVMQKVSLCDFVSVRKIRDGIRITCNKPYIPTDERNIVYKVADAFYKETGITPGVHINLKKHIPCGAGLGGGSSNGAAVLDGLCKLYNIDMDISKKVRLCENIGADIPFFFYDGTCLIEGIGEKVTPVSPLSECWIVIVKPPKSISTPTIFKHPLTAQHFGTDSTEKVLNALENQDVFGVAKNISNALEPASIYVCPEIEQIKKQLVDLGAIASMMSGSGSSVFGIFQNHKLAKSAREEFLNKYNYTYITKPLKEK